jgi:hypothetical protein
MRHHNLQVTGSVVVNGLGLATTADLTSYTASADAKISTLQSFTASVGTTNTFTASAISRLDSIETITASNVARLTSLEIKTGSLATTGSNTFYGTQVFSGSLYVQDNLIVQGSSSLQNITASAVSIGTNIVYLNTDTPAVRFAGLTVQDSGSSAGVTGSMLWDSLCNRWIYSNPSTIGYSGGMLLSGPRTQTLGTEPTLTCNYIAKSGGGDHLYDSCIIDDGTTTCIKNNLIGTGTTCFAGQVCVPTIIASTCLTVKAGAATSVVNNIAGAASNNHFAIQRNDTQYASIGLNASDSFTIFGTSTSCPRLTIDSNGISCFGSTVCAAGNLLLGGAGTANTIPQYTAAGVLGNSRMTTYGTGCYNVNFGWSNCGRIGFDNDNTGTYFYGLELDNGTRRLNIIGKAPDGNAGVSIWTGTTSYNQRLNINASGIACFSCQICTSFISANAIDVSNGGASTPTNACVGYGMFGYSGVGLGITSGASGGNQGIGFFVCGVERGRWITNGNLGIGTVCPNFPLDVNGTIRSIGTLIGNNGNISSTTICTIASTTLCSSRGILIDANTTTNNAFVPIGFSWASSISSYDPTWGMAFKAINYNAGIADLAFYTAGNVRMTVTNGGSVGIGTTGPAARLDVSGTVKISDSGRLYINQFLPLGIVFRHDEMPDGDGSNTSVTDTQATNGNAKRRLSSAASTTFFYGPYTTIPAGTYIAYFRLKVTNNSSGSTILYMDITNAVVPGGGIYISPSSFTASNRYQYFKIPFTVTDPTAVMEFRGLSFVGGITDIFLDHIMILPGS